MDAQRGFIDSGQSIFPRSFFTPEEKVELKIEDEVP
jgi:hypothetical protein